MKKNRSSFFHEQTDYMQSNMPGGIQGPQNMPNPNMMYQQTMPTLNAQSSFYAGPGNQLNQNMAPGMNQNMNMQPPYGTYPTDDIESRLAKLERQINRLEHRIAKIEQSNVHSTEDFESTINDMYMV